MGHPEKVERNSSKPSLFSFSSQATVQNVGVLSDFKNQGKTKAVSGTQPIKWMLLALSGLLVVVAGMYVLSNRPVSEPQTQSMQPVGMTSTPVSQAATQRVAAAVPARETQAVNTVTHLAESGKLKPSGPAIIYTETGTEQAHRAHPAKISPATDILLTEPPPVKTTAWAKTEEAGSIARVSVEAHRHQRSSGTIILASAPAVHDKTAPLTVAQSSVNTSDKKHGKASEPEAPARKKESEKATPETAAVVAQKNNRKSAQGASEDGDIAVLSALVDYDKKSTAAASHPPSPPAKAIKADNKAKLAKSKKTDNKTPKPVESLEAQLAHCDKLGFMEGGLCRWQICSGSHAHDPVCGEPRNTSTSDNLVKIPGMGH